MTGQQAARPPCPGPGPQLGSRSRAPQPPIYSTRSPLDNGNHSRLTLGPRLRCEGQRSERTCHHQDVQPVWASPSDHLSRGGPGPTAQLPATGGHADEVERRGHSAERGRYPGGAVPVVPQRRPRNPLGPPVRACGGGLVGPGGRVGARRGRGDELRHRGGSSPSQAGAEPASSPGCFSHSAPRPGSGHTPHMGLGAPQLKGESRQQPPMGS